ncbi:MAG: ABC transporter substrate-binding protein [Bacteroidota bacterium]
MDLTLALDWTPNINHIGFFVALEQGFYSDRGLTISILDPSSDSYSVTPAKKVELGAADLALCPTESLLSYQTKSKPYDLVGIAAVFQHDVSAIVVLGSSGISSPKQLDGTTYASYEARYEDEIVRQMIRNAGGEGTITTHYPKKLGIWDTLVDGTFTSTWIFENWEGVLALHEGISLTAFRLHDYGIPYSYSPMIVGNKSAVIRKEHEYRAFLEATRQGYQFAMEHPVAAVDVLKSKVPVHEQNVRLDIALERSIPAFGSPEQWGTINPETVQQFLDWIYDRGLEDQKLTAEQLLHPILN